LAVDHHYSPLIAHGLRTRGHAAIAVAEADWEAEEDESLLTLCGDDQRALLTNNVADFVVIGRRWQTEGRSHYGLIFTSDASLPRTRDNVGRYVDALDALMTDNPAVDGSVDRTHWL
jgi:Domain of unknown function (DUF5615)